MKANNTTQCAHCHATIDVKTGDYHEDGLLCSTCSSHYQNMENETRGILQTAYTALGFAIISLIINPFYLFTGCAIFFGIETFQMYTRSNNGIAYRIPHQPKHIAMTGMALAVLCIPLHSLLSSFLR